MQTNNIKPQYGKVFIAGFGPGNPELLTIKTSRLLDIADIIYHDDLLDAGYLDRFSARITSYNVCYTKLLRVFDQVSQNIII